MKYYFFVARKKFRCSSFFFYLFDSRFRRNFTMRPAEEKKKKENKRKGKRAWTKVRKISRLLIFRTASARRFHKMSPGRSMLRERGAHALGSVSLSVIKRVRTGRNGKYDAGSGASLAVKYESCLSRGFFQPLICSFTRVIRFSRVCIVPGAATAETKRYL